MTQAPEMDDARLEGVVLGEADASAEPFDRVVQRVRELCGRAIVTLCTYDPDHDAMVCQAEAGGEGFAAFCNALRRSPANRHFHVTDVHREAMRRPYIHVVEDGLYALLLGSVSRPIARGLEMVLRVRSVYAMALMREDEFFGVLGIVSREPVLDPETAARIEVYVHRVSPMIYRANLRQHVQVRDAEYRLLMARSADALLVLNREGYILDMNPAACALLHCKPEAGVGGTLPELTGRSLAELLGSFRRLKPGEHAGRVCRLQPAGMTAAMLCDLHVTAVSHDRFLVTLTDHSAQLAVQRRLLDAAQRERRRIGRDLHDSVGQSLTGITFLAHSLAERLESVLPDAAPLAGDIRDVASGLIGQVRTIANGLSVSPLDEGGLAEALCAMAARVSGQSGIACEFVGQLDGREPPPMVADELYYLCQEAVTNAMRHSGCTRIRIRMELGSEGGELVVEDNGRGMEEAIGEGMGMRTMRYRAALIGGELSIESDRGKGSRIRCILHGDDAWQLSHTQPSWRGSGSTRRIPA